MGSKKELALPLSGKAMEEPRIPLIASGDEDQVGPELVEARASNSAVLQSTDIRKVLDGFLEDMGRLGRSKATVEAYRTDIRQFIKFCESDRRSLDIKDVDAEVVEQWDLTMVDSHAATTRNRKLAAFAAMCDYARKRRLIQEDPMDLVERAREVETEAPCPTPDEVKRILKAEDRADWRLVILFVSETGLRRSEVIELKVGDLDLAKAEILVRHGKGDKRRVVPILDPGLRTELEAHVKDREPDAQLFSASRGGTLRGSGLWERFRRAIRRAGLENRKFTPHSLRHYFLTQKLEQGHPIHVVQKWAGHADPSMILKTYAHVQDEAENARVAASAPAEEPAAELIPAAEHACSQIAIPVSAPGQPVMSPVVYVNINGRMSPIPLLGAFLVVPGGSVPIGSELVSPNRPETETSM